MSLLITLAKGVVSYSLRVDSISHTFTRFPAVTALPYFVNDRPQVFSLDLGQSIERFTLQGIGNAVGDPSANDPSKTNLESVCRSWSGKGTNPTVDLPRLTIGIGAGVLASYFVHIQQAEFRQEGAQEDRWNFSIILIVRSYGDAELYDIVNISEDIVGAVV